MICCYIVDRARDTVHILQYLEQVLKYQQHQTEANNTLVDGLPALSSPLGDSEKSQIIRGVVIKAPYVMARDQ